MTNTQHAELMAELVAISRATQRIADACERSEVRFTETVTVPGTVDHVKVKGTIHTNITPPGTRGQGKRGRK